MVSNVLLRLPAVLCRIGNSRSALCANMAAGLFPRPVKIGRRASAWSSSDVEAVNAARIAGKSDAEIRRLVEALHYQRAPSEAAPEHQNSCAQANSAKTA
jgi:prophage regulatory protein